MAKVYYRKIKNGDVNHMTGKAWTLEDVPAKWQGEVQEMIDNGE